MTDRELLEAAAKAAGIVPLFWHDQLGAGIPDAEWWNPLTDDGDALRLAVTLQMELIVGKVTTAAVKRGEAFARETNGGNPCAATRRAIVRAAAELGK